MRARDQNNHGDVRSGQWAFEEPCPSASCLHVTVLFTTVPKTLCALRQAAYLANDLGARLQILIPVVVPYPLPLDKPCIDPEFRFRQFRTRCAQEAVETRLEICLCRDSRNCVRERISPHSLVLLGGEAKKRRIGWPWTYEKRLERELGRAGHQVVIVDDESR